MAEKRELDIRDSVKVVTSNSFITSKGLDKMSLKAKKLLYIAAAQCQKNDDEFYEYKIKITDFARLMDVDESNVYREAFNITGELASCKLSYIPDGTKKFKHIPVTSICEYSEDGCLKIELNKRMTDFLLQLKKDFSQPLLNDFMRMRSPYSMAVWHLMQREMHSQKPGTKRIEFYLSLEELREVTGTQDKLRQLGQFKERVLDKAIREIRDNCATDISYTNRKKGRTVIGFEFTAINQYGIDLTDFEKTHPLEAERAKKKARKVELKLKEREGIITDKEYDELQGLILELDQMTLEDYKDGR
jgi:plasmid replication initiation protein